MSGITKKIIILGAATVAVFGILSSAAANPPPWIVSAGAAPVGTIVSFKAGTIGPQPQLRVTDTVTGQQLNCTSSRLGGRALVTNSNSTGNNLFYVVGPTFTASSCINTVTGVALAPNGSGPWSYKGVTYSSGITYGRLNNVNILWSGTGCSFKLQGFVRTRFYNNTPNPYFRTYAVGTGLAITVVSGCPGLTTGDQATMVGTYQLQPNGPSALQIT